MLDQTYTATCVRQDWAPRMSLASELNAGQTEEAAHGVRGNFREQPICAEVQRGIVVIQLRRAQGEALGNRVWMRITKQRVLVERHLRIACSRIKQHLQLGIQLA